MIYDHPLSTSKVDQGDIIDDCPLAYVEKYQSVQAGEIDWAYATSRVIVLHRPAIWRTRKLAM